MAITVKELQAHVRELKDAQAWHDTTLEQRLLFLVTEIGEVAEEVLRLSGAVNDVDREEARNRLGLELYDVLWNLCDLANLAGIDLEEHIARKAEVNRKRRW
jgi:NTP pyrophosphatase (non-canonical NTP hydrolase)